MGKPFSFAIKSLATGDNFFVFLLLFRSFSNINIDDIWETSFLLSQERPHICVQKTQARLALLQSRIISCLTHKIGLMGRQWQLYSLHVHMLPTRPGRANKKNSPSVLSAPLNKQSLPPIKPANHTISETDPALHRANKKNLRRKSYICFVLTHFTCNFEESKLMWHYNSICIIMFHFSCI